MTANSNNNYCGIDPEKSIIWQKYFNDLSLGLNHYTIRCVFSEMMPTVVIILFNTCIIFNLIRQSHRLTGQNLEETLNRRKRTTSWMNIVLFLHSLLFFFSLLSHIGGHFMSIEAHETWWVILAVLLNSSLNFYIYCLSSKAFRKQTIRFIRHLTIRKFHKVQIRRQIWKQRHFKRGKAIPLRLVY